MTVAELIELLKTFPPELQVVYPMWSEQLLLEPADVEVKQLCEARPDGWVANARPDKPTIPYLYMGA